MKATNKEQINTPTTWDRYYNSEEFTGFVRILDSRKAWMLNCIEKYKPKFKVMLDVGCGFGELIGYVDEKFPERELVGMDMCPMTIGRQQKKDIHEFILSSAEEKFPLKSNTFDVVFCGETLEHLTNIRGAIKELYRVCKPGGLIMLTVPLDDRNDADEHMWEISRQDLCGVYPKADLMNYELFEKAQQCAAFIKK